MLQELLTPLILAVFAAGFLSIWVINRDLKSSGLWAVGYFLLGFGFLVENFVPKTDTFVFARVLGDLGYIFGALSLSLGIVVHFKQSIPFKWLMICTGCTLVATGYFWFVEDNIQLRSQAISYGIGIIGITCAFRIFPVAKTLLNRAFFWIAFLSSAQHLVNTVFVFHIAKLDIWETNFNNSAYLEILNFATTLSSLGLAGIMYLSLTLRYLEKYQHEATTDTLTGLQNRRALEQSIIEVLEHNQSFNLPAAFIVCDIDHFKSVNDIYGHSSGDKVIKTFANVLEDNLVDTSLAGRYGGEEFIILLNHATEDMGRLFAEGIRSRIANMEWPDINPDLTVTVSFGVVQVRDGENYDMLFKRADEALYLAKRSGRNKVCIGSESHADRGLEFDYTGSRLRENHMRRA